MVDRAAISALSVTGELASLLFENKRDQRQSLHRKDLFQWLLPSAEAALPNAHETLSVPEAADPANRAALPHARMLRERCAPLSWTS